MNRKPQPLIPIPPRKVCPVCGAVSYSSAGIHPQCAMREADEKRLQGVKRPTKSHKSRITDAEQKPWQKRCPKCREVMHCRKAMCECGHKFASIRKAR